MWLARHRIKGQQARSSVPKDGQPKIPGEQQTPTTSSESDSSLVEGMYELDLNEKMEMATTRNNHKMEQPVYSHEMENLVYSHELDGHGNHHELGSCYFKSVQERKNPRSKVFCSGFDPVHATTL